MNWRKPLNRVGHEGDGRKLPLPVQKLVAWFQTLAPRERNMVLGAAAIVLAAIFWWVLLAPALSTLSRVNRERPALDAQWQRMLAMQQEAQALQAQPRVSPEAARQALEASTATSFGDAAKLQWAGERANITVTNVSGAALSQWLSAARSDAKAVPVQVRLTRVPGNAVLWSGLISVGMPQP